LLEQRPPTAAKADGAKVTETEIKKDFIVVGDWENRQLLGIYLAKG
jgi:hypothetical protein